MPSPLPPQPPLQGRGRRPHAVVEGRSTSPSRRSARRAPGSARSSCRFTARPTRPTRRRSRSARSKRLERGAGRRPGTGRRGTWRASGRRITSAAWPRAAARACRARCSKARLAGERSSPPTCPAAARSCATESRGFSCRRTMRGARRAHGPARRRLRPRGPHGPGGARTTSRRLHGARRDGGGKGSLSETARSPGRMTGIGLAPPSSAPTPACCPSPHAPEIALHLADEVDAALAARPRRSWPRSACRRRSGPSPGPAARRWRATSSTTRQSSPAGACSISPRAPASSRSPPRKAGAAASRRADIDAFAIAAIGAQRRRQRRRGRAALDRPRRPRRRAGTSSWPATSATSATSPNG